LKKIKVKLAKNSYSILVAKLSYQEIADRISKTEFNKNLLIVADENVNSEWGEYIRKPFEGYKNKIEFYDLKAGENSKSYIELNNIYSFLIDKNFGRDTLIIAIGGGVTGDLVGYAASTFMRGIQLIHVPTTLLSAVDSSIGGKTGINFNNRKNMIGSFFQPKLVLIDTNFLSTLPQSEMISGIGEIVKYTYLSPDDFFDFAKSNLDKALLNDEEVIHEFILRSAAIKAAVVSQDGKESNLRKILNLGHTFGHAIESDLNFEIKHGQAVLSGLISALYLSNKIGILKKNRMRKLLSLPLSIKLPSKLSALDEMNMINIMQMDKKNRDGKINFVLLSEIGNILIDVQTGEKDVLDSISSMKESFKKDSL